MLYILQRHNVAVKAPPSGATAMSMKKTTTAISEFGLQI